MLIVVGDGSDSSATEARAWVLFARRFLEPDSYRLGYRVAAALGLDATRALEVLLRRMAIRVCSRDAFACVEAADILRGEIEAQSV